MESCREGLESRWLTVRIYNVTRFRIMEDNDHDNVCSYLVGRNSTSLRFVSVCTNLTAQNQKHVHTHMFGILL